MPWRFSPVVSGVVLLLALAAKASDLAVADATVLREAGFRVEVAELLQLVERHYNGSADAETLKGLIAQMGSDSFAKREAASRKLLAEGAAALEALRPARKHADLEIARRARTCVEVIEGEGRYVTQAMRTLLRSRGEGTVKRLLALRSSEGRLRWLHQAAVMGSNGEAKWPLGDPRRVELLKGIEHEDQETRDGVVAALTQIQGQDPLPEVLRLARHENARVREAAICLLGSHKDKPTQLLPYFTQAMKEADPGVRRGAARTLRYFSGVAEADKLLIKALKDHAGGGDPKVETVAVAAARSLWAARGDMATSAIAALGEATRYAFTVSTHAFLRARLFARAERVIPLRAIVMSP